MTPTQGRIVTYTLTDGDAGQINGRRTEFDAFRTRVFAKGILDTPAGAPGRTGHMAHVGNEVSAGDEFPALIVRVFGPAESPDLAVNLKVQLDGSDDFWATSRMMGDGPGTWSWPKRTAPAVMTGLGDMVHYFSHGTPVLADGTQAYAGVCRAAFVTEIGEHRTLSLMVANPTGQFFTQHVEFHDGAATPGDPGCPHASRHGSPHRYCACGWMEASYQGGTWHRPGHC